MLELYPERIYIKEIKLYLFQFKTKDNFLKEFDFIAGKFLGRG